MILAIFQIVYHVCLWYNPIKQVSFLFISRFAQERWVFQGIGQLLNIIKIRRKKGEGLYRPSPPVTILNRRPPVVSQINGV